MGFMSVSFIHLSELIFMKVMYGWLFRGLCLSFILALQSKAASLRDYWLFLIHTDFGIM